MHGVDTTPCLAAVQAESSIALSRDPEPLAQGRPGTSPVHPSVVLFRTRRGAIFIALFIIGVMDPCRPKQLMCELMDGRSADPPPDGSHDGCATSICGSVALCVAC